MKIYDEWIDRVMAPEIRKGHIQQLYQHIYPRAYNCSGHGKRTNLTEADCASIVEALEFRTDGGPEVTEAQYIQGSEWLLRYGKRLGLPERIHHIRPTLFRFPCCEMRERPTGYGGEFWLPVYVAYYNDGSTLTYSTGSWQSQTAAFEFTYKEAA